MAAPGLIAQEAPVPSRRSGAVENVENIDGSGRTIPAFEYDIAIVGLGYVGLPTALAFHAAGSRVLGLDVSERRLSVIREERADLLPTDRERLSTALTDGEFSMTADVARLSRAAAVIVCVPTPVDHYLMPDLAILRGACAAVVEAAVPGQVLVLTSTTYVGTTRDMLIEPLSRRGLQVGTDIFVAFSPERIDPGNDRHAHEDVPRVLGGVTPACSSRAEAVLKSYARNVHIVPSTDAAEMTKLVENTFRAVNIALANEFAEICQVMGMEVMDVINAAATKPYGFMPFFPGPGVGGHCIPCDPHYLLWQLRKERLSTPVIEQAMTAIAARPHRVVDRIRETLSDAGKGLHGARVLVVGVSYKPDVEDLRESPALEIMSGLIAQGATIAYSDPFFQTVALPDGTTLIGVDDPVSFDAEIVLVHTAHKSADHSWLAEHPLVLDATYRMDDIPSRVLL
jgi:UDP-N-acetyl-D-glucosamine dehydrogenase